MLACIHYEGQARKLLQGLIPGAQLSVETLSTAAAETAGLLPGDLAGLAADAAAAAVARHFHSMGLLDLNGVATYPVTRPEHESWSNVSVEAADIDEALKAVRIRTSAAIGAPQA